MTKRTIRALALCLAASVTTAQAQEYVTAKDRLSDDDFYRLVTCAAEPGGECRKPVVRWSKRDAKDISVRIVKVDDLYPSKVHAALDAELDQTIQELNAAGANLKLSRADDNEDPDIGIHLLDMPAGGTVKGTGFVPLDGTVIETAWFQLWWRDNRTLINCEIVFSRDLRPRDVANLLLEEVTQCMGLMTDIGGRYYERRSILSETGYEVTRLGEQDIMALRRHYP